MNKIDEKKINYYAIKIFNRNLDFTGFEINYRTRFVSPNDELPINITNLSDQIHKNEKRVFKSIEFTNIDEKLIGQCLDQIIEKGLEKNYRDLQKDEIIQIFDENLGKNINDELEIIINEDLSKYKKFFDEKFDISKQIEYQKAKKKMILNFMKMIILFIIRVRSDN